LVTFRPNYHVFEDLGFASAEAAVLQMRSNLMSDLRLYIEKHKLSQSEAANRLGIAQSRVSDLVRGKWDKFSLEMFITLEALKGNRKGEHLLVSGSQSASEIAREYAECGADYLLHLYRFNLE
jgi:predicted XRE-type DNA-binding protein